MKTLRLLALAAVLLLAGLFLVGRPIRAAEPTPADIDLIQKVVRDYLAEHPEVIIDAIKAYQDKQASLQVTEEMLRVLRGEMPHTLVNPEVRTRLGLR